VFEGIPVAGAGRIACASAGPAVQPAATLPGQWRALTGGSSARLGTAELLHGVAFLKFDIERATSANRANRAANQVSKRPQTVETKVVTSGLETIFYVPLMGFASVSASGR
jgi:hypothetical protein